MGEVIQFPKDRWQHDDFFDGKHYDNPYCVCNNCMEREYNLEKLMRHISTDDPDA